MKNSLILFSLIVYTGSVILVSIMTYKNFGVSTPKIVKKSVRVGSARRHRYHGGYYYGK